MRHEPGPLIWEENLLDSRLEVQLAASIANAASLPRALPHPQPGPGPTLVDAATQRQHTLSALETQEASTQAQLIAGCGIAAIDGYLAMRDYAASKNLDLVELHHKGIDLQDLISIAADLRIDQVCAIDDGVEI